MFKEKGVVLKWYVIVVSVLSIIYDVVVVILVLEKMLRG